VITVVWLWRHGLQQSKGNGLHRDKVGTMAASTWRADSRGGCPHKGTVLQNSVPYTEPYRRNRINLRHATATRRKGQGSSVFVYLVGFALPVDRAGSERVHT